MIRVENVSKRYGSQVALKPITLDFRPGAITALIGESGCGKSTLLRVLVGLVSPDTGRVLVDGTPLAPSNAERLRQRMGYVIQDGGLFPHLSAEGNVTLLARFLKRPPRWIEERLAELAELTQLPRERLARHPKDLSGGQRQRVALMRALMLDPEIVLLDEPLGALDPITRRRLQEDLKRIFARLGKTVILVTHDMGEAAYLGDEIVMLREGRMIQRGTLDTLLKQPAEPYVIDFIRAQRSPLPALGGLE